MEIVFFSNYLNHHQIPLAEAFNSIEGINYTFVAVSQVPEFRKSLGYEVYKRPYLLEIGDSEDNKERAKLLAMNADVAIFLATPLVYEYIIPRLKANKLSFEYSERWFKKRFRLNLLSPRLWKYRWFYHKYGVASNLYMLAAGAYVPNDFYFLHTYMKRCFKWGYFPETINHNDVTELLEKKKGLKHPMDVSILWVARLIGLKHPTMAVNLAERLKKEGYVFTMNLLGDGNLRQKIERQINNKGLQDCVHLLGAVSHNQVYSFMSESDIFLFTSDQNEGWGAVLNEAMSSACAVVASHMIGSVPYLIKDGENGYIFKSCDDDSLYHKVKILLDNKDLRLSFSERAYHDICNVWSARSAARRFLQLVEAITKGENSPFGEGPCSNAIPINIKENGNFNI